MESFIRDVAHRIWLKNLKNASFFMKESELDSNHILFNNKKISRVYIIATVIQKFENDDNSYAAITIDDGSSDIRVKSWKEDTKLINNFMVGDLVLVVGRVRKYEDEIYISPEIVKKVNPNWELVHKLILFNENMQEEKEEIFEEPGEIRFK
ncbi:DNA-binding protein [Candidatus Woesearchaeota archaeon]|nr:DNA-binding protein [Candidatus Woesearchaeota archaeon]